MTYIFISGLLIGVSVGIPIGVAFAGGCFWLMAKIVLKFMTYRHEGAQN